jgi:ATP-dependent exoDNAse (exonuclease V) beta subunit
MTDRADANARSRISTEFGTTFFVEAAAGTGKTTALVGRIVGLIRSGRGTLAQTVAVTFTEKAAGEMKLRLRLEIEKARADATSEERARLNRALEELELARIGTIHAFCGDLLSERPIEAGVDPVFTMLDDEEAAALADQAFERWLQRILAGPPEGPRRILRRRSGLDPPQELLRTAMHTLREHRDFPRPWRRDPFDRNSAIDALMRSLADVAELGRESSRSDDWLARNLAEIARFVREATRLEVVRGRDYDGLEAELRELARNRRRFRGWGYKGWPNTTFGDLTRDEVLTRRDAVRADLEAFIASSEADLAPLLHEALQDAIADYELLKSKSGCLDFLDLLIKARDLVRDNAGVRRELQSRFSHFFIDEFQDTDPLQAEILLLLAADDPSVTDWRAVRLVPGKLFLVGDPKQSIYRFRRADVTLYEDIKRRLLAVDAEVLHLTTSFRAPPSIQRLVNDAFAPAIAADPEASGYVALEPSRPEIGGRPTIVALPVPKPYGDYGNIIDSRINESFPGAVGAFVDWLINESGWTVEEERRQVPIRPRHIAILFRRFRFFRSDVTRPYVRALEARRIPHVLVGGRSFHDREEVMALRNAITAIEWPDDELKVFATLRGPFFALSDEALLAFRQQINGDGTVTIRHLNPARAVDRAALDPASAEVADALDLLRRLHAGRNSRPIAETVTMLLQAVRAHAGIALWQNGEQALANCQRLIDMARHFERRASSFRAFVESVEEEAEHGEVNEAPIVEEGTEGVRVMTVYKAKGLEFPVVILADPTCPLTREQPNRHIDAARSLWLEPLCGATPIELREASDLEMKRDRAEAIRVAYVAATRARDLMIVPTCGDEPIEGWLEILNPVLYPTEDARRRSQLAPGCPVFGEESVLERGPKGRPPAGGSVRPGLHVPAQGGAPIVWWDPAVLALEVEELAPLRQQRILEADADGAAAAESKRNYAEWKTEREALLAKASEPSLLVRTVTSLVRSAAGRSAIEGSRSGAEPRVNVDRVERGDIERPGGRRFGALVHALLASIDFKAGVAAVEAVAAVHGRIVGATGEEMTAAIATIGRVLEHPILRRAAIVGNEGLRRETPVMLTIDDGSLIEGVIDLAFRDDTSEFTGWTVVDFKTDREFDEASDQYIAQVRVYSKAVAAATSTVARGVLLVV